MTSDRTQVLVVGGGSAGVAAAIGAAEHGASVMLIERYGFLGGQATSALVGTICGLFLRDPDLHGVEWAVTGAPRRFAERLGALSGYHVTSWRDGLHFLPYAPTAFRRLCDDILREHHVAVRLHAIATDVRQDAGWTVQTWWGDRPREIRADALVDCTGVASLARASGVAPLPPEVRQATALGAHVAGFPDAPEAQVQLALVREMLRAAHVGALPPEARGLSLVPGTLRDGAALVKLALGEGSDDPEDLTRQEFEARAAMEAVLSWLRGQPGWSRLRLIDVATQLGVRTGPRPQGRKVLAGADVLAGSRPADGVAVGAWPMERWTGGHRPTLTMAPLRTSYLIPAGCLRAETEGLYFAGRNLSADEEAISSARVIGTAMSTGYAAGALAALHIAGLSEAQAIARVRQSQEIGEDR